VTGKHPTHYLEYESFVAERGLLSLRSFVQYPATAAGPSSIDLSTINMLTDNVLLSCFRYYVAGAGDLEGWLTLECMCRRWRYATAPLV
jgi:hypothetical protein